MYYSDEELSAATETVVENILAPMNLKGITWSVVREVIFGFIQRETANALTAAAKVRQNETSN